ncbi:MAG: hypothetical protein WCC74_03145 [Minisyncoccia bacterium]
MLSIQRQIKYFSRVMTMPNGLSALVYFELIERNGNLIAKAVRFEEIQSEIQKYEIIALPVFHESFSFKPLIKSPFSYLTFFAKDLLFFTSQRTRAPSII